MKREEMRRRTKCLTISALLSALGVILLAVGSLLDVMDLSVAAIASLFCIYAVIEMGGGYPWMIWAVTCGLAWLLLPQKSPALFYLLIGFYPILKELFEKLRPVSGWILKILYFHVALALVWLGFRFLLTPGVSLPKPWYRILLYVAALFCFVLYDVLLTRLITFYLLKLRGRLGIK